jgi:hypothetical protein
MQVKRVSAGEQAWVPADDATVVNLQASTKDASGKPAKLVQS